MARNAASQDSQFAAVSGIKIQSGDIGDMFHLNSACVEGLAQIVGFDVNAAPIKTQLHDGLREAGRKWALHVLEGPYSWCLSAAYILATVISGCPLFLSLAEVVMRAAANDPNALLPDRLKYSMLALDSVFYCFLPLCFSMLLRVIQGRELLARLGKRTLVIADVPYVHQLLESYVSKLFSQSYSIASIDVHGANGVDHLVHRFTHRVYRGTLIAVGRTDGRLFSQSKGESWILMAMQQCKAIMHLGAGPEIVSVGHNPFTNTDVLKNHVVIDNRRPRFLCEVTNIPPPTAPLVFCYRIVSSSDWALRFHLKSAYAAGPHGHSVVEDDGADVCFRSNQRAGQDDLVP